MTRIFLLLLVALLLLHVPLAAQDSAGPTEKAASTESEPNIEGTSAPASLDASPSVEDSSRGRVTQEPDEVDQAAALPRELTVVLKESDKEPTSWLKENGSTLIGLLGILLAVVTPVVTLYMFYRSNRIRALESESDELNHRLKSFYRPCHQLLKTSKTLYDVFRARQPDPANFRTLTALLEGQEFHGNDAVLLKEILEICERIEDLIIREAGVVEPELQILLAKAIAHFRILRLACSGSLKGEPDKFSEYVFPRDLDEAIATRIETIEAKIQKLKDS